MVELLNLIGGFPRTTPEPDRLAWGHHRDGDIFCEQTLQQGAQRKCKKIYRILEHNKESVAPSKVKCFTWLLGRAVCQAMQKRGVKMHAL